MIKRIVKMTFTKDKEKEFKELYAKSREKILAFKGIHSLELMADSTETNVLFTLSTWDSENDLEKYRKSDFFKDMWSKTKKLFDCPAEAWSLKDVNHAQ